MHLFFLKVSGEVVSLRENQVSQDIEVVLESISRCRKAYLAWNRVSRGPSGERRKNESQIREKTELGMRGTKGRTDDQWSCNESIMQSKFSGPVFPRELVIVIPAIWEIEARFSDTADRWL